MITAREVQLEAPCYSRRPLDWLCEAELSQPGFRIHQRVAHTQPHVLSRPPECLGGRPRVGPCRPGCSSRRGSKCPHLQTAGRTGPPGSRHRRAHAEARPVGQVCLLLSALLPCRPQPTQRTHLGRTILRFAVTPPHPEFCSHQHSPGGWGGCSTTPTCCLPPGGPHPGWFLRKGSQTCHFRCFPSAPPRAHLGGSGHPF